jgi:hypothetical protein
MAGLYLPLLFSYSLFAVLSCRRAVVTSCRRAVVASRAVAQSGRSAKISETQALRFYCCNYSYIAAYCLRCLLIPKFLSNNLMTINDYSHYSKLTTFPFFSALSSASALSTLNLKHQTLNASPFALVCLPRPINQSTNQPINQSTNQPIIQAFNHYSYLSECAGFFLAALMVW